MSRISLFIIIGGLILAIGLSLGVYEWLERKPTLTDDRNDSNIEEKEQLMKESRALSAGNITDEQLAQYEKDGLNPFGHDVNMNKLADYHYQEYIHGMSHQKVAADKKWGFYEIHTVRIQWLLDGLEVENQVQIVNKNQYRNILNRWIAGDFSKVDQDHNTIWEMQDGTVGEATGILSAKEEKEYIESVVD
ncbi:DUF6241 domain-containing protein [Jeotgalibacillus soli]|uniref:Uncharacterized protein n=1 Tax=Jeotgalibacillus soli TaxID=889306 RepID=A0A0C2RUE9_9BACL|nr:DUF6241 domain-containing protein [Jeotgalibacillus soli]KIL45369.1 hypothetical protein KP78_29130 [Jeotgalibacillus soli]